MITINVSKTENGYTLSADLNVETTSGDIKNLCEVISRFTDNNSIHIYGEVGKKGEKASAEPIIGKKPECANCMNYEPYEKEEALLRSIPAEIDQIMEAIGQLPLAAKHNILNQLFDDFHEGMKKECRARSSRPAVNIPIDDDDDDDDELF